MFDAVQDYITDKLEDVSEQVQDKVEETVRQYVQRFEAKANEYLDEVLQKANHLVKDKGLDPLGIPDQSFNFPLAVVGLPCGQQQADLNSGTLTGLSTLRRVGDVNIDVDGVTAITLAASVGVSALQAAATCLTKVLSCSPMLDATGEVPEVTLNLKARLNIAGFDMELEQFDISGISDFNVNITGPCPWNIIMHPMSECVTSIIKDTIHSSRDNIYTEIKESLGGIDIKSILSPE